MSVYLNLLLYLRLYTFFCHLVCYVLSQYSSLPLPLSLPHCFPLIMPPHVLQMKIPSKKMAHIPVYTVGFHSTPKGHGQKSQVYK